MKTLYERIGGSDTVNTALKIFYEKILSDDRVKHFFENVSMKQQMGHQKLFLTYAFGGVKNYSGKPMRQAHKRLVETMELNDKHFNAFIEHLVATLKELNIADDLIEEVENITKPTKNEVLNKTDNLLIYS